MKRFVPLSFYAHSGPSHRDVVPMVTHRHGHRAFAGCQLSYFFLISYNTATIERNATGLDFNMAFYFPDSGLAGRMRGGVLSSEAGMVDKGQLTRVTESHARSNFIWEASLSQILLSDHLHQNPL